MNIKTIGTVVAVIGLSLLIIWGLGGFKNMGSVDQGVSLENAQGTPVGEDNAGVVKEIPQDSLPRLGSGQVRVNQYTHKDPKFSFTYPAEFSVSSFKDGEGETVLVQDQKQGKGGFQIYITPQDEQFVVTKARILADAPGTVVQGEKEITVGGAKGLSFASKSASLGATREAWFTSGLYLYQITGYPEAESVIGGVVAGWKWE